MNQKVCGVHVPRREPGMGLEDSYGECMRPCAHLGQHLFQNSYGEYFTWEDDFTCECCIPEEEDRCFFYGPISKKKAEALIT
jgi:hypothetical protein